MNKNRPRLSSTLFFEALEPRQLLSASVEGGLLTIEGSDAHDRIVIKAANQRGSVVLSGSLREDNGLYQAVDRILIKTLDGNDRITIKTAVRGIDGRPVPVSIDAGDGNDRVQAGDGDDLINGGPGNDRINGGPGNDHIDGGPGNDRINGSDGSDRILGGLGDDQINAAAGHDRIDGGAGDDRLLGGPGRDTIIGGPGDDHLNGEAGTDTISYQFAGGPVDVSLTDRRTANDGTGTPDRVVRGFEVVLGSGFEDQIDASPAEVRQPAQLVSRATWIWTETLDLLGNTRQTDSAIRFLNEQDIDTVYLYAAQFGAGGQYPLIERPDLYEHLIAQLHAEGIAVHALFDGVDPLSPHLVDTLENITAYNEARGGVGDPLSFDAVHIDLEPWALPGWDADRPARIMQYLDTAQLLTETAHASDPALAVAFDAPFWFDTVEDADWRGVIKPLNQHILDIADSVTVLDYRDSTFGFDGILFHGQQELEYAESIGKPITIAVETSGPIAPAKTTFFDEGRVSLEAALDEALDEFELSSGFDGYAIHHFGSLRSLGQDFVSPIVGAHLTNDTGQSSIDRITSDATIAGFVSDLSRIAAVHASIEDAHGISTPAVNIVDHLQPGGALPIGPDLLDVIRGQTLEDGQYTLQLEAIDRFGNSDSRNISFALDRALPTMTVDLDEDSDTGSIADQATHLTNVTLVGRTEPNATVTHLLTGHSATADDSGFYRLTDVNLEEGSNTLTLRATDPAGNINETDTTIDIEQLPDAILLLDDFESYGSGQIIGASATSTPWRRFGAATNDNVTTTDMPENIIHGAVSGQYGVDWSLGDFGSARYVFDEPTDLTSFAFVDVDMRSDQDDFFTTVDLSITSGETTYHSRRVSYLYGSTRHISFPLTEQLTAHIPDTPLIPFNEVLANVTNIGFTFTMEPYGDTPFTETIIFDDFMITPDISAPSLSVSLSNDTGQSNSDAVSSDLRVFGSARDNLEVASIRIGIDDTPVDSFSELSITPRDRISFGATLADLEAIYGSSLEGEHTLHIIATDTSGNSSAMQDITFTLDRVPPDAPVLEVRPSVGGDPLNDADTTEHDLVTITGVTSPGAFIETTEQSTRIDNFESYSYGRYLDSSIYSSRWRTSTPARSLRVTPLYSYAISGSKSARYTIDSATEPQTALYEYYSPRDLSGLVQATVMMQSNDGQTHARLVVTNGDTTFVGNDSYALGELKKLKFSLSETSMTRRHGDDGWQFVLGTATKIGFEFETTSPEPLTDVIVFDEFRTVSVPGFQTVADDDGQFVLEGYGLGLGTNRLSIRAFDVAGNLQVTNQNIIRVIQPQAELSLVTDTGLSDTDRLTNDPALNVTYVGFNPVTLLAALNTPDPMSHDTYTEVLTSLRRVGRFTITHETLDGLAGGTLHDGIHTIHLIATDQDGRVSDPMAITFELDTSISPLTTMALDPRSDTSPRRDGKTEKPVVRFNGRTEPFAEIKTIEQAKLLDNIESYSFAQNMEGFRRPTRWLATANLETRTDGIDIEVAPINATTEGQLLDRHREIISGDKSARYGMAWHDDQPHLRRTAELVLNNMTDLGDYTQAQVLMQSRFEDTQVRLLITNGSTTFVSNAAHALGDVQALTFDIAESHMVRTQGKQKFIQVLTGATRIGFQFESTGGDYIDEVNFDEFRLVSIPERVTTADADGRFTFDDFLIPVGTTQIELITTDLHGNQATTTHVVTRQVTPALVAGLAYDTGPDDTDAITRDPAIAGTLTRPELIHTLLAWFDPAHVTDAVDIYPQLQPDGSFAIPPDQMAAINGGDLTPGEYTLHLLAQFNDRRPSMAQDVVFTVAEPAEPDGVDQLTWAFNFPVQRSEHSTRTAPDVITGTLVTEHHTGLGAADGLHRIVSIDIPVYSTFDNVIKINTSPIVVSGDGTRARVFASGVGDRTFEITDAPPPLPPAGGTPIFSGASFRFVMRDDGTFDYVYQIDIPGTFLTLSEQPGATITFRQT